MLEQCQTWHQCQSSSWPSRWGSCLSWEGACLSRAEGCSSPPLPQAQRGGQAVCLGGPAASLCGVSSHADTGRLMPRISAPARWSTLQWLCTLSHSAPYHHDLLQMATPECLPKYTQLVGCPRRMNWVGHVACRGRWEIRTKFWYESLKGREIWRHRRRKEDKNITDLKVGRCGLDSSGSG